jgi:hypothetical protein
MNNDQPCGKGGHATRFARAAAVFAAVVTAALSATAGAHADGSVTVLDTIGSVPLTTQFSVFGSGGQSVSGGFQSVGPTFVLTQPTTLTEVGAFANNCASIIAGVPLCPDTRPFVVEIHPVVDQVVQEDVRARLPLSDDNEPLVTSYESAEPNVTLATGKYAAVVTAQGADAGWILGQATSPFSYSSASTEIAILQPGVSYLTQQFLGFRIIGARAEDAIAPTLRLPGDLLVDATSPLGATVSYSVVATDNLDAEPTVRCTPESGSTFAIGDTTVHCSTTDASGNAASGHFNVHVRGAAEQLSALIEAVVAVDAAKGIGSSLAAKLQAVQQALASASAGDRADACGKLSAFIQDVKAQSGKALTESQAGDFTAAATRIRNVLACA